MRFLKTTDWPVRRGMLLAGLVAAAASVVSMHLPPWAVVVIAAALVLSCLVPPLRRPVWLYVAAVACVFLCLGGAYQENTVAPTKNAVGKQDTITAIVLEISSEHMVTVEVMQANRLAEGSRLLLYCNDQTMPSQYDTVCVAVTYKALYDTQDSYRADGVFLQAYPQTWSEDAVTVTSHQSVVGRAVKEIRARLRNGILDRLSDEEGALLSGICLGDKSTLSASTTEAFRSAGLSHILTVSGLHLSVVSVGVYTALRVLLGRRRLAAALVSVVVLFFMLLVGFTPSVVRAGVMCLVLLGGQLFTRRADGLNSMGLALLLLLAHNPYCLLDVGLQLSFGAAGGVLCLTEPIRGRLLRLHFCKPLADGLAVTTAASLPITPLLAYYFGEVSLVSPLANLLAVFPASVALVLGWIAMLCSLWSPLAFLADGILYLTGWIVRWLLLTARSLGGLPFATMTVDRAWILFGLTGACVLSILCLYIRTRGLLRRTVACLASVALLAACLHTWFWRDTATVTLVTREEHFVALVERDGHRGLLASSVDGLYSDAALVRACRGKLEYLVVGGGSAANAARLTAWLRQVQVDRVLFVGDTDWAIGLYLNATVLPPGTHTLSPETALTVGEDGWRLTCGDSTLALAANATQARLYFTTRGNGEWSVRQWR